MKACSDSDACTSYHEIIKAGGPRLEGAGYPTGVMPEASGVRGPGLSKKDVSSTKKKTSYHGINKAGGPRLEGAGYPTGVMPEASGVRGPGLSKKDVSSTKKRHHL